MDKPLAHIPIFARLDEAEQRALLSVMTRQSVEANQTIFWMGDPGDAFFLIDHGQVIITVPDERGEHLVLDTLGPGGFFGEISLLDGGLRTATVRAVTAVTLLVLQRDVFQRFLMQWPEAAIDILNVMGQRQRASTAAIRGVKNPNLVIAESTSLWQKASDIIAAVAASQAFTLFHICWFGLWILINVLGTTLRGPFTESNPPPWWVFDPFPFGLLTMVVSLEAIFLSIFVMVSQNRQAQRDRVRTDLDYQVNVKAHLEIMNIVQRLERIEQSLNKAQGDPPEAGR